MTTERLNPAVSDGALSAVGYLDPTPADLAAVRARYGLPTHEPGTPNRWEFRRWFGIEGGEVVLALPPEVRR